MNKKRTAIFLLIAFISGFLLAILGDRLYVQYKSKEKMSELAGAINTIQYMGKEYPYVETTISDTSVIWINLILNSDNYAEYNRRDAIPDAETAVQAAINMWYPIYEQDTFAHLPFKVSYYEEIDCWFVSATLDPDGSGTILGGTVVAIIQKSDGKVLLLSHTQ